MFQFFKRRTSPPTATAYAEEWRRLRDRHADPAIELATTKQALIISAASVLDRLWNGHGGLGWDESCEDDYIAPLREHLPSNEVFSAGECDAIIAKLDAIVATGRRNSQVPEAEDAVLEGAGAEVDYIVGRVVDWCRHFPQPISLRSEDEYRGHF